FIDNFNLFWSQRKLFTTDGLHPNKLGSRVRKDNILFSLLHPSVECASPLLNGTHTPGHSDPSQQLDGHLDNTTQAVPCPVTSHQLDDDEDSTPKDVSVDILDLDSIYCHYTYNKYSVTKWI
ncbi:MAG: hypothetical protein ACRC7D_05040, partial [Aeromonas popoffii]|uniref:hypothetical protein n=1 Tax=Aeromonas popoffii TaxID=70856 RepID=UPI003F323455